MLRVTHVITGLGTGGAEIMLDRLLRALPDVGVQSQVICLAGEGPIAASIRAKHVPLQVLGLPTGPSALTQLPRLARLLSDGAPQVVHTWMYHADLLGGLAARAIGVPVVWALHATQLDPSQTRGSTRVLVKALAQLSRVVPAHVVSCSQVGLEVHAAMGYDSKKLSVVPNGFETTSFRKDPELRAAARRRFGASDDDIVVGHLARFHPQKDHRTLLEAIALSTRREPRLRFVLFGTDVSPENAELTAQARQLDIAARCHLMGPTANSRQEIPGFDILVSSSRYGEAFPLVLGEAMSCEVPCVVTDVGDSQTIVSHTGRTVPPGNPEALASALVELARQPPSERRRLGIEARARIEQLFSMPRVAAQYASLYARFARQ
jgi:glycosyltransferase involved in cell wall biosynthesis